MFGTSRNSAQAYASVGLQTGAIAASPHKLIAMLLEGAMIAILKARKHMQAGKKKKKGSAINKLLQEVYKLLADLKSTWDAIDPQARAAVSAMEM